MNSTNPPNHEVFIMLTDQLLRAAALASLCINPPLDTSVVPHHTWEPQAGEALKSFEEEDLV